MADSETPRRAAACRNVSRASVTLYAPLPRPYAGPFAGHAQALRSHPRRSQGKPCPGRGHVASRANARVKKLTKLQALTSQELPNVRQLWIDPQILTGQEFGQGQ